MGAQDSMPTWGELCDCFEAELGATITRQQLTVARQPFPAGAATAGGQPAPADAATAPLEPPLAARLPVASPLYLLQTETHLAAARADVPGLVALLQRHPEHVTARGTLSPRHPQPATHAALQGTLPPCSAAHPTLQHPAPHPAAVRHLQQGSGDHLRRRALHGALQRARTPPSVLTRAPRYLDALRLVLAVRLTRAAVGAAPPLRVVTYVHTSGDPQPEPPPEPPPKRVSIFAKPKDLPQFPCSSIPATHACYPNFPTSDPE